MFIYDPETLDISEVNEAACQFYGYQREEFLSLSIADIRPPSEVPKLKKEVEKKIDTYNNAGIWKHKKKNGEIIYVRVLSHPINLDERPLKLVSIQDVTDQIVYQKELEMLFANSLDGIMLTNPNGEVYRANKAACSILGMTEGEIRKAGRAGILLRDEKAMKAVEARRRKGEFSGELTFLHASGRKIPVEVTTAIYENIQGEQRSSLSFRDISQRKINERKLQDIISHSTNLFYRHTPDHVLTYVSPQSVDFLGCTPEEAKRKWTDFLTDHPVNVAGLEHTNRAIKTGKVQAPFELHLKTDHGEKIWVRVNEAPVVEEGKTVAIVGSLTDITDQKEYEMQLQESLNRYNFAIKATSDAVWDWDLIRDDLYWSKSFENLFGHTYTGNPDLGESWKQYIHPEDREGVINSLENCINSEETHWFSTYRFKDHTGKYRFIEDRGYILRHEDHKPVRMIGAMRDVTEQTELKKQLEQAYKLARIGVWEYEPENDLFSYTETVGQIFGPGTEDQTKLESVLSHFESVDYRNQFLEALQSTIDDHSTLDEEVKLKTEGRDSCWVRITGETELTGEHTIKVFGTVQDITDRKEAQLRMFDALEERQRLLERITEAFFAVDQNWTVTYWNKQAVEFLGMTTEEIMGKNLWDQFPDAKELEFYKQYMRAFHEQISVTFEEYYPPVDAWFEVNAYPSEDGLSVFFRDITQRKQSQLALEEAFDEKEMILESIGDGFFTVDHNWMVTYWNSAAEHLLDTPRSKAMSNDIRRLLADSIDDHTMDVLLEVMENSTTADIEFYYESSRRWYDLNAYPSKDGFSVFLKDITLQKEREKQLKDSLKEKETLLLEVHHRVKNNLALVSSMMQLQAFEEQDDSLRQKLNDSVSRIKTIGNIHEILYQSDSFSRLEINRNIRQLISKITETYRPKAEISLEFDLKSILLNINQAIPVSLIINEVITNVYKHAFQQGDTGKMRVSLQETGEHIKISISDNGSGLPDDFSLTDNPNSVGLQLIQTLSEQLNAETEYYSRSEWTTFNMTFRKSEVKGSGNAFLE